VKQASNTVIPSKKPIAVTQELIESALVLVAVKSSEVSVARISLL